MNANPDEKVNEALALCEDKTIDGISWVHAEALAGEVVRLRAENVALKLIAERAEQERSNADARAHHLVSENVALAERLRLAEILVDSGRASDVILHEQRRVLNARVKSLEAELAETEKERKRWEGLARDAYSQGRSHMSDLVVQTITERSVLKNEVEHQTARAEAASSRARILEAEISRKDAAVRAALSELGRADFDQTTHIYTINRARAHLGVFFAPASPKPEETK